MSFEDRDAEIAQLFRKQQRADEASAPPFREILTRRRGRASNRRHRSRRLRLAGAAAVLLLAGLELLRLHRRPSPEPELPAAAAAIAAWKAPTDVLLSTPGSDLLSQAPDVLSTLRESDVPLSTNRKGVEK